MSEETKDVKDIKITTVEKVKDPKRVEAGKKLAAMSKQAKEKKAAHNNTTLKGVVTDEFSFPNVDIDPLVAVGVVGLAGLVVYYKFIKKSPANRAEQDKDSEPSTSEAVQNTKPKENTQNTQPKPKRVYRELDTLG